jgi:hypothetical protein
MAMQITEELESTEVLDLAGTPHPIKSLLGERPTIMVWLRHYG